MSELSHMLSAIVDAQTEHPVYPRLRVEIASEPGMVMVHVGERVLEMPSAAALQMIEGRQRTIKLEEMDPFRHGYEPPFWS